MKPTKMRNRQIYGASHVVRSLQLGASLSKDLQKKHERRSIRVVVGDTVKIVRGEYKDVEGKVSKVDTISGRIAVEGVKKEKGQGEKFDVMIHASNVLVTTLKTDDSWRMKKLKGEPTPAHDRAQGTRTDDAADEPTASQESVSDEPKDTGADVQGSPDMDEAADAGADKPGAKREVDN